MALAAIIHTFDVELAENDWNVYESRAPRVARHPSGSEKHRVARVTRLYPPEPYGTKNRCG